MKQKKYSVSKIKTADIFLLKYDLSFDCLTDPQKQVVVTYTNAKKRFWFHLILFVICAVISSYFAFVTYHSVGYFVGESNDLTAWTPQLRGKACFAFGFTFCLSSSIAFLMLICPFLIHMLLRAQFHTLNAFLPALKKPCNNDQTSSN